MAKTKAFDRYSDEYDKWFTKNPEKYEAELALIRGLLPCRPDAAGIEIGVGSGKFAAPLGIKTGVEPSAQMAARAEKQGIKVISGIAENLPLPDESFDFLLMVTTLCFLDDATGSLKEARRVLKNQGFLIVGFMDKNSELGRKYEANKEKSKFYRDASFLSSEDVLEYLKNTGFKPEIIKQTLIPDQPDQAVLNGFGLGAFVGVRAVKT
ncbi:MAG: class I SAM-dependent methyltransferase [Desulfobacterales bacterium]